MGYTEFNCPHCGKKNRESCNTWMYDTPVRRCNSCGKKYLNSNFREVAIDGFDPRSGNKGFYLKGTIGLFLGFLGTLAWHYYQLHFQTHYSVRLAFLVLVCLLGSIGCLVMYIRAVLGIDAKKNEQFMSESVKRLQNPSYVAELQSYGYKVPERFLK